MDAAFRGIAAGAVYIEEASITGIDFKCALAIGIGIGVGIGVTALVKHHLNAKAIDEQVL